MIRPAEIKDAEAIAKVHVDSWRTTYRGIVAENFLKELSYEKRAKIWREKLENPDPSVCTFVAEDEFGEELLRKDGCRRVRIEDDRNRRANAR